jgi:hypothetical protein
MAIYMNTVYNFFESAFLFILFYLEQIYQSTHKM